MSILYSSVNTFRREWHPDEITVLLTPLGVQVGFSDSNGTYVTMAAADWSRVFGKITDAIAEAEVTELDKLTEEGEY